MQIIEEHWHDQPCVRAVHSRRRFRRRNGNWIDIGVCRIHPCYCWLLVALILMSIAGVIGAVVGTRMNAKESSNEHNSTTVVQAGTGYVS